MGLQVWYTGGVVSWGCRCGTLGVWSVGAAGVVHWGCGQLGLQVWYTGGVVS